MVCTTNDSAYQTALDWHQAGREVVAVVDTRSSARAETWLLQPKRWVLEVIAGHGVIEAQGGRTRVKRALIAPFNDDWQRQVTGCGSAS